MKREEKFKKIKEIILNSIETDAIVLFGSYAREKERPDSDIDIAIKPVMKIDKTKLKELQNAIEEAIDTEIHLINKYSIIERCIKRINEIYNNNAKNLENFDKNDKINGG